MIEITDSKVKIKGTHVDILEDFLALVHVLYERFCEEEDMPKEIFLQMFTEAVRVSVEEPYDSNDEDGEEEIEVEKSDYLS